MKTYKFKWEKSESWFMRAGNPRNYGRLEILYRCVVCQHDIPKENTALIIEVASPERLHTNRLCMNCVGAITNENFKLPITRSE